MQISIVKLVWVFPSPCVLISALLLVSAASYVVESIDADFLCHLRQSIKECFVVSQTRSIVLSLRFCCFLWPEKITHLQTTCLTPCHPVWSALAAHQCFPFSCGCYMLSVCLPRYPFPSYVKSWRITWYSSAQSGSACLSIERREVL